MLELARADRLRAAPGVAASASLAFTLEDAAAAPLEIAVEPGTKVQSVPGPGELPQTFETIERLEARAEWNALPARRSRSPGRRTTATSTSSSPAPPPGCAPATPS